MKLVIAIVGNEDASFVLSELTKNKFSATKLQTSGGFLRAGNATFMIGVEGDKVDDVIKILSEYSSKRKVVSPIDPTFNSESIFGNKPVEITIGGATVFVLDVEQFLKL